MDQLRCDLALAYSTTVDAKPVSQAPADTCIVSGKPALVSADHLNVLSGASAIVVFALGVESTAEASSWIEWSQVNASDIAASNTVGEWIMDECVCDSSLQYSLHCSTFRSATPAAALSV